MKKCLTLIALMLSLASFASPNFKTTMAPWDQALVVVKIKAVPVDKQVQAFTDPYVTNIGFYPQQGVPFPTYFQIQCSFNTGVPVPYYVIAEVWGKWSGTTGASPKYYELLFSTGQGYKTFNFPLSTGEEIYPSISYYTDYGPQ